MNALDEKGIDKVAIYALKCPVSGEVRYIGKANNPRKRLLSHMRDAKSRKTPVYSWLRSLPAPPVMEVLEWVEPEGWAEAERRLIALHRLGGRLLNLADGGDAPKPTKEQLGNAARASVRARESDPQKKKIWHIKRTLGQHLAWLDKNKMHKQAVRLRFKLGLFAAGNPAMFGVWANVFSKVDESRGSDV